MKKCLLLLGLIFFSWGIVYADSPRITVVSDIDDTLKIARVRNLFATLKYALRTNNPFGGMADLLVSVRKAHPQTQLFYLSNAKESWMGDRHRRFLKKNRFPKGGVVLRTEHSSRTHKKIWLERILQNTSPEVMILIGDNGEKDIEFYDEFVRKHDGKGITFIQLIRLAYSSKTEKNLLRLRRGQVGFITPVEIASVLKDHGLLSLQDVQITLGQTLYDLSDERLCPEDDSGGTFFPDWKDIRDWKWTAPSDLNGSNLYWFLDLVNLRKERDC